MNQFDENHYKFQRYPDRKSWSYSPIAEPKWMAWLGGIAMGCVFALMLFWGVGQ